MAQVRAKDLRGKSPDELKTRLGELAKEAYNLRFRGAMGELENLAQIRLVRREIARIKTVMHEGGESAVKAKTKTKAKPKAKAGAKKGKAQ